MQQREVLEVEELAETVTMNCMLLNLCQIRCSQTQDDVGSQEVGICNLMVHKRVYIVANDGVDR